MATVRDEIILAACTLLEKPGYPTTGPNEIVKESAHRKARCYYIPGGKGQIVSEAVRFAGQILVERMRDELAKQDNPIQALYEYVIRLAGKRDSLPQTNPSPNQQAEDNR